MRNFRSVLLIDEDTTNNLIVQKLASNTDFSDDLTICTSAKDALEFLSETAVSKGKMPDLIFLDIRMPVMSGWDFLDAYQKIKKNIKLDIPILIMSSSNNPEDLKKADTYPEVKGYYVKPITMSKFKEIKRKFSK